MIVCHCHCVSDRDIRESVRRGSASPDAIGRACGAGTGCGGCRPLITDIVHDERRQRNTGGGAGVKLEARR